MHPTFAPLEKIKGSVSGLVMIPEVQTQDLWCWRRPGAQTRTPSWCQCHQANLHHYLLSYLSHYHLRHHDIAEDNAVGSGWWMLGRQRDQDSDQSPTHLLPTRTTVKNRRKTASRAFTQGFGKLILWVFEVSLKTRPSILCVILQGVSKKT